MNGTGESMRRVALTVLCLAAAVGLGGVICVQATSGFVVNGNPVPSLWGLLFGTVVSFVVPWVLGREVRGAWNGSRASLRSGLALVLLAFATLVQTALLGLGIVVANAHGMSPLTVLHGLWISMFLLGLLMGLRMPHGE
ncbi:MAG: hypothetical protein IPG63_15260 [Xanthomonadales bacterium]|nr:hypothetical protein [Xanthomonadales bacterium]